MPRIALIAIVLVVLLGGALWLANHDQSRPLTRIEKSVSLNAAGN